MEQNKQRVETICYVAGHSGGHIIPCVALAQQEKEQGTSIIFFSGTSTLDRHIMREHAHLLDRHVPLMLTRGRSVPLIFLTPFLLFRALVLSMYHLIRSRPVRIITTGGIVALPVCLAGWLLRIPIELYELNATPGKAIRFLSPIASKIHVCFIQAMHYFSSQRCIQSPYPLRFKGAASPALIPIPHFLQDRLTMFVQGGSQGSQLINSYVKKLVETHPDLRKKIQIIHQTGSSATIDWADFYRQYEIPAHAFVFETNMEPYYTNADLIICRAGAGALFETLFFTKQCIVIPLEQQANNHQLENAQAITAEHPHLFHMIRQHEDVVSLLYDNITKLQDQIATLQSNSKEMHSGSEIR